MEENVEVENIEELNELYSDLKIDEDHIKKSEEKKTEENMGCIDQFDQWNMQ